MRRKPGDGDFYVEGLAWLFGVAVAAALVSVRPHVQPYDSTVFLHRRPLFDRITTICIKTVAGDKKAPLRSFTAEAFVRIR